VEWSCALTYIAHQVNLHRSRISCRIWQLDHQYQKVKTSRYKNPKENLPPKLRDPFQRSKTWPTPLPLPHTHQTSTILNPIQINNTSLDTTQQTGSRLLHIATNNLHRLQQQSTTLGPYNTIASTHPTNFRHALSIATPTNHKKWHPKCVYPPKCEGNYLMSDKHLHMNNESKFSKIHGYRVHNLKLLLP
jgi:hypothetical protein